MHRAHVALSMVLSPQEVVAVLARVDLDGWADAERSVGGEAGVGEEEEDSRGADVREGRD